MLAASRFEGGSWVRAGFLLTYAAFAYGCVVTGMAVLHLRSVRLRASLAGVLAAGAIGALALPAIEFPDETLNGFRGLDVLSVIVAVALAAVVIVDGSMRLAAALCLAGVLTGNWLIQHYTTRGSTDRYGLLVACSAALGSVAAALWRVRGAADTPR